jgi:hypothetical protein
MNHQTQIIGSNHTRKYETHCLKTSYIDPNEFLSRTPKECLDLLLKNGFKFPEDQYHEMKETNDGEIIIFGKSFILAYETSCELPTHARGDGMGFKG